MPSYNRTRIPDFPENEKQENEVDVDEQTVDEYNAEEERERILWDNHVERVRIINEGKTNGKTIGPYQRVNMDFCHQLIYSFSINQDYPALWKQLNTNMWAITSRIENDQTIYTYEIDIYEQNFESVICTYTFNFRYYDYGRHFDLNVYWSAYSRTKPELNASRCTHMGTYITTDV
jgi:hypothetical protein